MSDHGTPGVCLLHFGAPDVRDLILGAADGGMRGDGLGQATGMMGRLRILERSPGGWAANIDAMKAAEAEDPEPIDVVIASVSGEVADPSPDPPEALIELARHVHERAGQLIVLNASTLTPGETNDPSDARDPLALRIRRLNLAVLRGSKATGLCVVDADRLVAESPIAQKVVSPFDYAPSVRETLRSEALRILRELGIAEQRTVMELHVPFIRRASTMLVERWLKAGGDPIVPGEIICELKLVGVRSLSRPTNAFVLASINGREPLIQRMFSRERVRRRAIDATVSVVSADSGVLRTILRPDGAPVHPDDPLALLTVTPDSSLDAEEEPSRFRAVTRIDDATGKLSP